MFYNLDNEPDLWGSSDPKRLGTHQEVHPTPATYSELVNSSIAYATAIKAVSPNTIVFGGVNYGWQGYVQLQSAATDASITDTILNFQASYLKQMHAADVAAGKRLVDVLDMHWYPEAVGTTGVRITNNDTTAATVAARVQAARSLWDPTYTYNTNPAVGENSWITRDSLPYQPSGTPAQFKTTAIQLLPREQSIIDQYNPGTKIGISEYQFGAGGHISGGVAEADALGVFGQQGVFAANWWPDGTSGSFVNSAFNMYLNYDNHSAKFGNTSVQATNNSIATTAAYASVDAGNPNRMVVVLINRTNAANTATLNFANTQQFSLVDVYQLAGASATISHVVFNASSPQWQWLGANSLSYNMPAMSVTTLSLVRPLLGDLNLDGRITNADIQAMLDALINPGTYLSAHNLAAANLAMLGDFFGDGVFSGSDLMPMLTSLAHGSIELQGVPEPPAASQLIVGCAVVAVALRLQCGLNWRPSRL